MSFSNKIISSNFNFFKDVFFNSSIGMGVCSISGQLLETNEAMCQLAGASREELLIQNFYHLDSWKKSGLLDAAIEAVKCSKQKNHEATLTTSFGRTVTIDSHIIPFKSENEEFVLFIFNDITDRKSLELEKASLIGKLKKALSEVKTLQGIIPICMPCKGIRDDKGCWNQLENYISNHSNAKFSHGICDSCFKKHYPKF